MPAAKPKKTAVKKVAAKKTATKKTVKKSVSAAAVKKAADEEVRKKSALGIKYSDKSAGQENLIPIFESLVKLFQPYIKGSMKQKGGRGGEVALISDKPIVIDGRKKPEMHFAAALIQKGYVGFYFMPVYAGETMKKLIKPELLKTLKGKACFHIKKLDAQIESQIKEALQIGYDFYKKQNWID